MLCITVDQIRAVMFAGCCAKPERRHNPFGVGNVMRPGPGVAPCSAQPRALRHNLVEVGKGTCVGERALTDLAWGEACAAVG